jgi:hypothetical protein
MLALGPTTVVGFFERFAAQRSARLKALALAREKQEEKKSSEC